MRNQKKSLAKALLRLSSKYTSKYGLCGFVPFLCLVFLCETCTVHRELNMRRFEQVEVPAQLLDNLLWSDKSNINQTASSSCYSGVYASEQIYQSLFVTQKNKRVWGHNQCINAHASVFIYVWTHAQDWTTDFSNISRRWNRCTTEIRLKKFSFSSKTVQAPISIQN